MSDKGYTLGISSHFHDSSAALLNGRQVVAAAQEERFTRKKGDWSFPQSAVDYCLSCLPDEASLQAIAYYENPGLKIDRIVRNALTNAPRGAALWPRTLSLFRQMAQDIPERLGQICPRQDSIFFVPHHRSHAASAFYPSPFEQAAILVLDGVGEWSTTSIWDGEKDSLNAVKEIRFPCSLGMFYSAFTQYCGFKVNSGEYKLMGLAPFGAPHFRQKILDEILDLRSDGSFALNMDYFNFDTGLSTISPMFEDLFGQPVRHPGDPLNDHYMNIAASAQSVVEEAVLRLGRTALALTGRSNLCLAGGVALNCVANSHLLSNLPELKGLWVQPAAGDAGGALGAALDVAIRQMHTPKSHAKAGFDQMASSLLGPVYSKQQIHDALTRFDLVFEAPGNSDDLIRFIADALAEGLIVGHFDGRMEFGPRALGNRSILADPRGQDTLERVNRSVKFREDWRPFAPMILAKQAAEYFEAPTDSPYMLLVSNLLDQFRMKVELADARAQGLHEPLDIQKAVTSQFPAVTHVDFSSRIQTIDAKFGSRAHDILQAFHELTECPMLLNTSFNVRGEPIVCSPEDAIACFLTTGLDILAIGPFIARKNVQPQSVFENVGGMNFAAD